MKTNIQIPQDILAAIDFANTTNGGMSEPMIIVNEEKEGYEMAVKAAGLEADSFQIDVVNGNLWVYHLLPLYANRPEGMDNLKTIRTLGNMTLPNGVDTDRIAARYDFEAKQLRITLPFNHKRNQRRHIDVEKY